MAGLFSHTPSLSKYEDLEIFLQKRAEAATLGKPIVAKPAFFTEGSTFSHKKFTDKPVLVTKLSKSCEVCRRGYHMPYHCDTFKAISVSERGEKVKEMGIIS